MARKAVGGQKAGDLRVRAGLVRRLRRLFRSSDEQRVSSQLQQGFSIGIAAVRWARSAVHTFAAAPLLAYSCSRDYPQGLQL